MSIVAQSQGLGSGARGKKTYRKRFFCVDCRKTRSVKLLFGLSGMRVRHFMPIDADEKEVVCGKCGGTNFLPQR